MGKFLKLVVDEVTCKLGGTGRVLVGFEGIRFFVHGESRASEHPTTLCNVLHNQRVNNERRLLRFLVCHLGGCCRR